MVYEAPLARPDVTPVSVAFDQCTTVFATDVSGSTDGIILQEEKDAIQAIVEHVPTATQVRCSIAPWDDKSYPIRALSEIDSLRSGGGTEPAVLLNSDEQRNALRRAHLWFLLTDGLIGQTGVNEFAEKVAVNGLHNKACVLIVFGYRRSRPIECNISVGVSVFGMAPDALFLFNDVDTHEVFVFQSKGCFTAICGKPDQEIILNKDTQWCDLPTLRYDSIINVRIPPPQDIRKDGIILQNREQLDLESLTQNTLSEAEKVAILENDSNMKSMLITMSARGKQQQARNWIGQQRLDVSEAYKVERLDQNGAAVKILEPLLQILSVNAFNENKSIWQKDLREAHLKNWIKFAESTTIAKLKVEQRNLVVDDAVSRLTLYDYEGPSSPTLLSPVSPTRARWADKQHPASSDESPTDFQDYPTPQSDENGSRRRGLRWRFGPRRHVRDSPLATNVPRSPPLLSKTSETGKYSKELPELDSSANGIHKETGVVTESQVAHLQSETSFLPGYTLGGTSGKDRDRLACPLCGSISSQFAILLRSAFPGADTPGFPVPNSCSEILFPLAMSLYRETDIVSQLTCCCACAYHVVKMNSAIARDYKAALPVAPTLNLRANKSTWLGVVDDFFEQRFERRNLMPVMLGIFTEARLRTENLTCGNNSILHEVLNDACDQLRGECRISYANGKLGTLDEAASFYLRSKNLDFRNELFQHPFESFCLLLQGSVDFNRKLVCSAVFMRTVLHIVSQCTNGRLYPPPLRQRGFLNRLKDNRTATLAFDHDRRVSRLVVKIESLVEHGLVEETALLYLGGLQPVWNEVLTNSEPALYACLLKLAYERSDGTDEAMMLEKWRSRGGMAEVFADPLNITDDMINGIMIASP